MEFSTSKRGGVTVVHVPGPKITSREAPDVKTTLLELIIGEGEKFLLDLSSVENMDSTGLGAFLFGIRQADQHEKDMRFCCVQSKVQFLVRIAHLEQVIDIYDNVEQALKAFEESDE